MSKNNITYHKHLHSHSQELDHPCNFGDGCNNKSCRYDHPSGKGRPGLQTCLAGDFCRDRKCNLFHTYKHQVFPRPGLRPDCPMGSDVPGFPIGELCHDEGCNLWHDSKKKRQGLVSCGNGTECDFSCIEKLQKLFEKKRQLQEEKENELRSASEQRRIEEEELMERLKKAFEEQKQKKKDEKRKKKERKEKIQHEKEELFAAAVKLHQQQLDLAAEREQYRRVLGASRPHWSAEGGAHMCRHGDRCVTKGCGFSHPSGNKRPGLTFCPKKYECEDPLCNYGHPNAHKPLPCYGGDFCPGDRCRFSH